MQSIVIIKSVVHTVMGSRAADGHRHFDLQKECVL